MKTITLLLTFVLFIWLGISNLTLSQNPMWTLPNSTIDYNQPPPLLPQSLPTPTDPNNTYDSQNPYYYYQGQPAECTHNSFADAQGKLLFYVVDEKVYDSDGYIMGWLYNDVTNGKLMKGTNEMVIVQDPGNCSRYYIIATAPNNYNGNANQYPHYAILDLSIPSTFFGNRRGALVPFDSEEIVLKNIIDLIEVPPFDEDWAPSKFGGVYYAVSPQRDDNSYKLFISSPQYVYRFTIDENGLHYDNYTILIDYPVLDGQLRMRAQMELKQLVSGDYFFATPYFFSEPTNPFDQKVAIMVTLLNANGTEYPGAKRIYRLATVNNEFPYISGLEFSENGQYLYITHKDVSSRQSCIEYIDLAQTNFNIYPLIVDTNKGRDYQYSQLEMGLDNRIYCVRDNPTTQSGVALASLSHTNSPLAENWNANAIAINFTPNFMGLHPDYQTPNQRCYILPDQIDGFDYFSVYNDKLECCVESRTGNHYLETTQNQTWTTNMPNAPFEVDNGVVYVRDELRIKAGTILTLENMEFHFSPNAKVIVERGNGTHSGGKLILKNTTFTVDTRCSEELMWLGVEVHGNPNENQGFPHTSPTIHTSPQGAIYVLSGSRIEHALRGITAGFVLPDGLLLDAQYSGGMIGTDQSTFFNNQIDVEFGPYNKLNSSYFHRTEFITDGLLNDPSKILKHHIYLVEVNRINIRGCTFSNLTPTEYPSNLQGVGITSINSRFFVDEYCAVSPCSNSIRSKFEDLSIGVVAAGFMRPLPFSIDRSDFLNNHTGIYALNVNEFKIQRNVFEVYKSVAPNYDFKTFGIHIANCTGYIVQENNFYESTEGGITGQGNTIGILVDNSGTNDNEIYKNSFRNLNVGGQSQRINSIAYNFTSGYPNNQGLRWKCNDFTQDMYEADLGVTSGRIAYQQGHCLVSTNPFATKAAAGNIFSHSGNNSENDIWVNTGVLEFNYAHHADLFTTPIDHTYLAQPQHCSPDGDVYYNSTTSCPTRITADGVIIIIANLKQAISGLGQTISEKEEKLENGSSTALIQLIEKPSVSHDQKKYALLDVSPFLSDEVLKVYIQSNAPVDNLVEVLSANSPLSTAVWNEVEASSIPSGVKRQLEELQTGVSERTYLINELGYERSERAALVNELVATYWLDTTLTTAIDSIEAIIELEKTGVERIKARVEFYLKINEIQQAQTALDDYITVVGNDEFVTLAQYAIDASLIDFNCLFKGVQEDDAKRNAIRDIADNLTESHYCTSARSLLEFALDESYDRYVESLIKNKTMQQQNEQESEMSKMEENEAVRIFPNPTHGEFFVVIDRESNQLENVAVTLYSLTGQKVKEVVSKDKLQMIAIDVNNLSEGMYLVIVTVDGAELSRQKVAVK